VTRTFAVLAALAAALAAALPGAAATPGVTATKILLGGTAPLSGGASFYAPVAVGAKVYFDYVNARGGVNGRKIEYRYRDDAFNPAQTVQATRELVERDGVLAIFNTVGTPQSIAVRGLLNEFRVPQLFAGAALGRDYREYPLSMGYLPSFFAEGRVYGRYIARTRPNAKIAVIYERSSLGEELLAGLKAGLGSRAGNVVATEGTNTEDPDISSPIASLKASNAEILAAFVLPKQAVQAFIGTDRLGWRPKIYVSAYSIDPAVMAIARFNTAGRTTEGAVSVAFLKDATNKRWAKDKGVQLYKAIMKRYGRGASPDAVAHLYGMAVAHTMVTTLKNAGRNLTRDTLMRAARSLNEKDNPFLLPGIVVQTGARDYFPIEQAQMYVFRGAQWQPIGGLTLVKE
jgi:branched-chain amino acid transport system substrate-binding protein